MALPFSSCVKALFQAAVVISLSTFVVCGCSDSFHEDRSGYVPKMKAHVFEVPSLKLLWEGEPGIRVNQDVRQIFMGPQSAYATPANNSPYFMAVQDETSFSYLHLTKTDRIKYCEPSEIAQLPVMVPGLSVQFFLDQALIQFQGKVAGHFKMPEDAPIQSKAPGLRYLFMNKDRSLLIYRPLTFNSGLSYVDDISDPKAFHVSGLGNILSVFESRPGVCTLLMCKKNADYGKDYYLSLFDPHAGNPLEMLTLLNNFEEALDARVLICPEANRILFCRPAGSVRVINAETGQEKTLSASDMGMRVGNLDIALVPGTKFAICGDNLFNLDNLKVVGKLPQFSLKKPFAVASIEGNPGTPPTKILYFNSSRGQKDVTSLENTRISGFDLAKGVIERQVDVSGPWDQRGNEPVFLPEAKKVFFVLPNKLVVFSGDSTKYLVQE